MAMTNNKSKQYRLVCGLAMRYGALEELCQVAERDIE
jgi:hypothetical protein